MSLFGIPGWVAILICGMTVLYFYFHHLFGYFVRRGIPYKKPWPFVGSMFSVIILKESMFSFIQNVYNQFEGHPVCGFFQFMTPVYMVRDLDLIKQIIVKDFDYFTDHRGMNVDSDQLFGRTLFQMKGQKWKENRNTLTPAFTSSKIKGMFTLATKCGEQLVAHIDKLITEHEKKGEILQVDARDLFTRYTNDVIATSAFGIHCDSLSNPNNEFYAMGRLATNMDIFTTIKINLAFLSGSLMKWLKLQIFPAKVTNFFKNLVRETIETRDAKGIVRPDMIHLLMQARQGLLTSEEEKQTSFPSKKLELSYDDIAAHAFSFFFAGFDPTATTICFMVHLIADHPEVQEKLLIEIDDVLQNHNGELTYSALQDMKYLDMVLNETLRIYPAAGMTDRLVTKKYHIEGHDNIPNLTCEKDQIFWIPIFAIHNDPKYFPNPEKFDPERFSEENKSKILPYSYLPFGVGPRSCIGNRFALMEVKLAIATILSRFSINKVPKTVKEVKISKKFNLTIDGGFWVGFKRRNKN